MADYVVDIEDLNGDQVALAGGKGASLGELSRIDGIRVPSGFCVTTAAFAAVVTEAPAIQARLERLAQLSDDDADAIRTGGAELRRIIVEDLALPAEVTSAIVGALARHGRQTAYAVRSSATAEDLPSASFAGQHDSYLDVVGPLAVIEHVRRCWASLFTERAIAYRQAAAIDHRDVQMAVIVQQMVPAATAGVLFTADPMTSNRRLTVIEAVVGLGEALVSGRAKPDTYVVRDGDVIAQTIASERPMLTTTETNQLEHIGRRIEAHFGRPQDIEWCLTTTGFQIVQSRPITTLFPIPAATDDVNHVYVSVGHQQMMTDAMKPLGLSVWQLTTVRPMAEAGGRLFVDVTRMLGSPKMRAALMNSLGGSDPLIGTALQTLLDRGDFIPPVPDGELEPPAVLAPFVPLDADPALPARLVASSEDSIAALTRDIHTHTGPELIAFIEADIKELQRTLFDPRGLQVIRTAADASRWLSEHLAEWLGEKDAVDTLTQSVPGNVTSEMGLALLDVADVIRPHPEVVAFLRDADADSFMAELPAQRGGQQAHDAIEAFLEKYGMRCVGEFDITRTRWSEWPAAVLPMILANVAQFETGEAQRRFEHGRQRAAAKEDELITRLRALPDGAQKAEETKRMIDRVRTFSGYREYPKYGMVSRYAIYKQALLAEAGRLTQARVLADPTDISYLRLEEIRDLVRTHPLDHELLAQRRAAFRSYRSLTPPRVLTSEGEAVVGTYGRDDLPDKSLAGLAVSAGAVEGRARVVLDIADAELEAGDILVTTYTDPSWTPLFVAVAALVTEVGGLMTHGAVIAREYGLPAVVGVEHATRLIRDGQRIRVDGTGGYVELLP